MFLEPTKIFLVGFRKQILLTTSSRLRCNYERMENVNVSRQTLVFFIFSIKTINIHEISTNIKVEAWRRCTNRNIINDCVQGEAFFTHGQFFRDIKGKAFRAHTVKRMSEQLKLARLIVYVEIWWTIFFTTKKFDTQFFFLPMLFVSLFPVQIFPNKITFFLSWNLLSTLKPPAKRNSQYPIGSKNKVFDLENEEEKSCAVWCGWCFCLDFNVYTNLKGFLSVSGLFWFLGISGPEISGPFVTGFTRINFPDFPDLHSGFPDFRPELPSLESS
jgi:hypothetical protein